MISTKTRLLTRWEEKYRPSTLKDYVGNEAFKKNAQKWINTNDPPNLLLDGPAGTGKTTLAKILTKNMDCEYLYINASDENNVDTVREKIKRYASTVSMKPMKVIILDEADYLTPNAQAALRNLMETFIKTCRFILTCNYVDKIISPLQSRCTMYTIIPPSKKDVAIRAYQILTDESVTFQPEDISKVVNQKYPDIRAIIKALQECITDDNRLEIIDDQIRAIDWTNDVVDLMISAKSGSIGPKEAFQGIRQLLADISTKDYIPLYRLMYDKIDNYAEGHVGFVIQIIGEAVYRDPLVVDKEINAMSAISQILEEILS